MNRPLSVTLVGGFLGSGKTSLLHEFISGRPRGNLAVLVESASVVNLDAGALRGLCGAMRRLSDTVLEIPAGDEDAQAAWIATKLRDLAREDRFERVIIEVAGTTNAARLARNFGGPDGPGDPFSSHAELRQIIVVVDALDFHHELATAGSAASFADFQSAQIEGASLIVLNKCDLVDDAQRAACVRTLRRINPAAPLFETAYGELPPEVWTRSATPRELGLALERSSAHGTSADAGGANSSLAASFYRAYRPFHPGRFWDWFDADHPGLLRVKGLVWLATRNLLVGGISRTRWQNACGGAGIWWAALPREEWPVESTALARMQETWREPYGDRRQELLLTGEAAALPGIVRKLDACLLTAEEYARPVREWTAFPDPFPAWDVGENFEGAE